MLKKKILNILMKNIILELGSADIKVMNWQIFDTEGNLFVTGKNKINGKKVYRDIYAGENENSLGILLVQGEKKAFFFELFLKVSLYSSEPRDS